MNCEHRFGRPAPYMSGTLMWPLPYIEDRLDEFRTLVERYRQEHFDVTTTVSHAATPEVTVSGSVATASVPDRTTSSIDLTGQTAVTVLQLNLPARSPDTQMRDIVVRVVMASAGTAVLMEPGGTSATVEIGADTLGALVPGVNVILLVETVAGRWTALAIS